MQFPCVCTAFKIHASARDLERIESDKTEKMRARMLVALENWEI